MQAIADARRRDTHLFQINLRRTATDSEFLTERRRRKYGRDTATRTPFGTYMHFYRANVDCNCNIINCIR